MAARKSIAGYVTNIQKFTIHDGPGIRTEIFLKGCPLRCKWCSNPECLKTTPEVGVYSARCLGLDKCKLCFSACSFSQENIFVLENNKVAAINRDTCNDCLVCAKSCPANALVAWGKKYYVDEIVEAILEDMEFYERSGGGVTLSGGDPLVQWQFSLAVIKECKKKGIHTCLETASHTKPEILKQFYPYTDLFITDLKHMDPVKHIYYTGVDNAMILQNINEIVRSSMPLMLRLPVIFGHNDSSENIRATADFITDVLKNRILQLQLLPYRQLGLEKYQSLGLPYGMEGTPLPERRSWEEKIHSLVTFFKSLGIPAVAGSSSKLYS